MTASTKENSKTNAHHQGNMKKRQTEHKEIMAEKKDAERGLLLVHTGDGKGKSTAAFGTVIRALGWGHKVGVVQFIKGSWKTGEKIFFTKQFPDLVTFHVMGEGFTWDTQDRERDIAAATAAWNTARDLMTSNEYDLVVLDELNIVLRYEYLPISSVIEGLKSRKDKTSVIVTGRDAPAELCDHADLVTEFGATRHPFEQGIKAKRGIDF